MESDTNNVRNDVSKTLWFEFLLSPKLLETHLGIDKCDPSPVELIMTFLNNAIPNGTREWSNGHVDLDESLTPTIPSSPSPPPPQAPLSPSSPSTPPPPQPLISNGVSVHDGSTKVLIPPNSNADNNNGVTNNQVNGTSSNNQGSISSPDTNNDFNVKKSQSLKLLAIKVATFLEWNLDIIEEELSITMQYNLLRELILLSEKANAPPELDTFGYITYFRWILRSIIRLSYPIRGPRGLAIPPPLLPQINPLFVPMEVLESVFKKLREHSAKAVSYLENLVADKKKLNVVSPLIECFPSRLDPEGLIKCDWTQVKQLETESLQDTLNYELGKWYFFNENYTLAFKFFNAIENKNNSSLHLLKEYLQSSENMSNGKLIQTSEITSFKTSFIECLQEIKEGKSFDISFVERSADLDVLSKLFIDCYQKCTDFNQRRNLKQFAFYLSSKVNGLRELLSDILNELSPSRKMNRHDSSSSSGAMAVEEGEIEAEEETEKDSELMLLEATDPEVIQDLISKVAKPPLMINRNWDIPLAHAKCLKNLPPPQYYKCHIVLAKAAELRRAKMYIESRILYLSLLEDFQASLPNLAEIITYELLQTDLQHHVESNDIDERRIKELLEKFKRTLPNDDLLVNLPQELVDLCCLFLLESGKHILSNHIYINSKNPYIKLSALISVLSSENASSKLHLQRTKELWDHILSLLSNSGLRVNVVPKNLRTPPPPPRSKNWNVETFGKFLMKLKNSFHISLLTSCFIHIYNLKRDVSGIELTLLPSPQINWPSLSSTAGITLMRVSELLKFLIDRGLNLQPNEINLIRCKAELALMEEMFADALKHYVTLMIITTEYFTAFGAYPEEDRIIQRMILCSTKLACHTQAALLHQMTKEPNYAVIFKSLSEKVCNDSCDDLYDCFWDITILEYLVNLHTRRGEIDRKNKSLQLIGQLELNANNSQDILCQAANVRKGKFFRTLAKKYL
ncbi:integrator complex subunit 8 [Brevipalpus obovatus]|uniref:integrator complex subunit 8 n=1 Tax=Brevipalpus obovatus TaxID=246614 RepID=UPI003D9FAC90